MSLNSDIVRVVRGTPTRGTPQIQSERSIQYATRGMCTIMPPFASGSLLANMFNRLWCNALDLYEAGAADLFLLHHDDIEPRTICWLDVLVQEMRRTGAAILCPVILLKNIGGETSTAMHIPGTWRTRRLTIEECWQLPTTFHATDVHKLWPRMAQTNLVINSGLLLVDLSRPEFLRTDDDGELEFFFTVQDRCVRGDDGRWKAESWSEDWDFSARCTAAGLPVYATTAVEVIHHGNGQWCNRNPAEPPARLAMEQKELTHAA